MKVSYQEIVRAGVSASGGAACRHPVLTGFSVARVATWRAFEVPWWHSLKPHQKRWKLPGEPACGPVLFLRHLGSLVLSIPLPAKSETVADLEDYSGGINRNCL